MARSPITDEDYWHQVDRTYSHQEFLKAAARGAGWWKRRNPKDGASVWMHAFERGALDFTLPALFKKAWEAGERFQGEDAQGRTAWAYAFRNGCGTTANPVVFNDRPNMYVLELLHLGRPSMRNAQGDGLLVQILGGEDSRWTLAPGRVLTFTLQSPQMPHRFGWGDWLAGSPEAQQRAGERLFDALDESSLSKESNANRLLEGTAKTLVDWWFPLFRAKTQPGTLAPALQAAVNLVSLLERGARTGSSPDEAVGQLRRRKTLGALTQSIVEHAPSHWWDEGALETWAEGYPKAEAWAQATVSAGRAWRLEQELPNVKRASKAPRF